jgi:uncharacterized protein (TIGR03083 family)
MSQATDGGAPSSRTDAGPWIEALRRSHQNLQTLVEPLSAAELRRPSYCRDWSIAQVVSHLGSQAEIFGRFLDAAIRGEDPPGRDAFPAVWDAWNSRSPDAQATDGLLADQATLSRFESLDPDQRERLRLQIFGMDVDTTDLARMRLGEHVVHTWDVAVSLDPGADLAPDAAALLVDTIGQLAGRAGKPDGTQRRMWVVTTDPDRLFVLETGDGVVLTLAEAEDDIEETTSGQGSLILPAAALIRLVYGRLDADHTPPVDTHEVDLDQLRQMFPGF